MIGKFVKYKKWKDYWNYEESEFWLSLLFSMASIFFVEYLQVYDNFGEFINPFSNLLLYTVAGFFGLLGFSLSGIAIITGFFNAEYFKKVGKENKEKLEKILTSYQFLSFNLGFGIIFFFCIYILLFSKKEIVSKCVFLGIIFVCVYFISFVIFYTVALVGNCIDLYNIKNSYEETIGKIEKSTLDIANEVKIDYILAQIANITGKKINEIIKEINDTVEQSELKEDEKDRIRKYLEEYFRE